MTRFRFASAITASVLATGLVTAAPALADPDPTTGVELNVSTSQFKAVPVTFDFSDSRTKGIPALKDYRARAWDLNLPYDGMSIRQQAAKHGLNSKEAYVNAVQADGGFARIAIQRAAENSDKGAISHSRPTNSTCQLSDRSKCAHVSSATYQGKGSWAEILAKHSNNVGIRSMIIDQWGKGEEKALRASSGQWTQQNGHVHTLINPELRYFGFGYVKGSDGWFTGAGFGSNSPITSDNLPGGNRTVNLHRAALANETPTGIVSGTPKPKPSKNPGGSNNEPGGQNNPGGLGVQGSFDYNNMSANSDILSSEDATDGQKAAAGIGLAVAILGIVSALVNWARQAGIIQI